MGNRNAGGVVVALLGALVLVAGLRGTLKNTWQAIMGPEDGAIILPGKPLVPKGGDLSPSGDAGALLLAGYPGSLLVPEVHQ
jgi:hypothetical protein